MRYCDLFNKDLGTEKETPKRLPQCISAEVEP